MDITTRRAVIRALADHVPVTDDYGDHPGDCAAQGCEFRTPRPWIESQEEDFELAFAEHQLETIESIVRRADREALTANTSRVPNMNRDPVTGRYRTGRPNTTTSLQCPNIHDPRPYAAGEFRPRYGNCAIEAHYDNRRADVRPVDAGDP